MCAMVQLEPTLWGFLSYINFSMWPDDWFVFHAADHTKSVVLNKWALLLEYNLDGRSCWNKDFTTFNFSCIRPQNLNTQGIPYDLSSHRKIFPKKENILNTDPTLKIIGFRVYMHLKNDKGHSFKIWGVAILIPSLSSSIPW